MKSKFLGHGANDLFWFILPLVLPALLVRYNLNFTQAGGLLTTYLAVTAVFSFAMGKLSDRFSRRKILSYGFFLASAGLASAGFAPTLGMFLVLISFTAVGVSTFHPVMYAVIDDNYSEKKGQIMGAFEGSGTAAILIMFLVNGFLITRIGVKGVLILTAVPALVMGSVYLLSGAIPENEPASEKTAEGRIRDRKAELLFLVLLGSIILRVFTVTAMINFLPTIFSSFLGYTGSSASYASAFFFAGGLLGSLYAGKLADRYNSITILMSVSALIIPSLLTFTLVLPSWMFLISAFLFGIFSSACIINQNLLIGRMGSHLGKGEVFGILMGVMTITASMSPAVFGALIDHLTFKPTLFLYMMPLILSILLLTFLRWAVR